MAPVVYILLCFLVGTSRGGGKEFISINAPGDVPEITPVEGVAKRRYGESKLSRLFANYYDDSYDDSSFRPNGYSIEDEKAILSAHNDARRKVNPPASDMEQMAWSRELADMAQRWSDQCVYEHPDRIDNPEYNRVGQNLYIKYYDMDAERPPNPTEQPINLWSDEKKYYEYEQASCQADRICGHYTQVAWATTTEVGCGMSFCEEATTNAGDAYPGSWLVTCNYRPGGNYRGQKPYRSGRPCAECPNGFCKDDLCSDCDSSDPECVCMLECQNCGTRDDEDCSCSCHPGFYGIACENACKDAHEYCGANPGWPLSWCNLPQTPFVRQYCPAMCELCELAEEGQECVE